MKQPAKLGRRRAPATAPAVPAAPAADVPGDADERSDDDTDQQGVQSIELGMRLLVALATHSLDEDLPMLKTLAATAGMTPSKAHRYLVSLSRANFVERDAGSGRYTLGGMARTVGYAAIRGMNVVRMATARLPKVRTALNQTTVLAIWSYHGPVVVSVEDVRRPVTVTSRVGDILPILTSASGRVFGAWLPPELTDELIKREIAEGVMQPQEGPIRNLAAAHALLAKTRTAGVSRIEGTPSPVISALAAPIFDYGGALVATLAVLGPTETFDSTIDGALATALRAAASEISQELGFKSAASLAPSRK